MSFTRRWRRDGAAALAAAAVLACCIWAAASGVSPPEAAVFHAINDAPDWLYPVAWPVQFLGLLLLPLAIAVIALAFRRWRLAFALALLVPLKLVIEKAVIKQLVDRQRPGTSICDGDADCLHLRGDVHIVGPSFPSGHVIIVCGIAWLVGPYVDRRWRWALGAICVAVALARMYLGAHNPLDVTAGAAAGVLLGAALNLAIGTPAARPI